MVDIDTALVLPKRGRGRPKKDEGKYSEIIERTRDEMAELMPMVGPSLRELIGGMWEEQVDPVTGVRIRVFQRPPNLEAIKTLLDRIMGRTVNETKLTVDTAPEFDIDAIDPAELSELLALTKEAIDRDIESNNVSISVTSEIQDETIEGIFTEKED